MIAESSPPEASPTDAPAPESSSSAEGESEATTTAVESASPSRTARAAAFAQRMRARADVVREEATQRLEKLEGERSRRPLVDILFAVRDEDDRVAGRELAAAVAYRLFFLMLPLILVVVGGLGLAEASSTKVAADAVRESGASAAVSADIAKATQELSLFQHFVVLGIGLFGTYFAGLGLTKTFYRLNAAAWSTRVPKIERKLRVTAIVLGLLVALIVASNVWNQIRGDLGFVEFLVALPVFGGVYGALVVVLHAQLPRDEDVPWSRLIPGALLIGIALAVLQAVVLGYIARKLSSSNALYGGVGTAIVLLFWLYLLGRVFVLGPLLDVVLWRRRVARSDEA
jgi:uncharacterized BrkB/YihY/UPF0761 family membrane protein